MIDPQTPTADGLAELLDDHQGLHSSFQIRHFIIRRAGLTAYGMYKQSLRELSSRWKALKGAVAQHRADAREEEDALVAAIERDDFDHRFADRVREFCEFYSLAAWLKDQVGELTPTKRDQLELEFWEAQLLKQAALDVVSTGRVGAKTYDNVSVCPVEMRDYLMRQIRTLATSAPDRVQDLLEPRLALPEFPVSQDLLDTVTSMAHDSIDRHQHALLPGRDDAHLGDDVAPGTD